MDARGTRTWRPARRGPTATSRFPKHVLCGCRLHNDTLFLLLFCCCRCCCPCLFIFTVLRSDFVVHVFFSFQCFFTYLFLRFGVLFGSSLSATSPERYIYLVNIWFINKLTRDTSSAASGQRGVYSRAWRPYPRLNFNIMLRLNRAGTQVLRSLFLVFGYWLTPLFLLPPFYPLLSSSFFLLSPFFFLAAFKLRSCYLLPSSGLLVFVV